MIRSLIPLRRTQSIPSPIDLRSVISEHNDLLKAVQEKRDALAKLHEDAQKEIEQRLNKLDEIIASVKIPAKGDKGEMGIAGKDGRHGRDGADGKDGETPVIDHKKIATLAAQLIPKPEKGKDAQAPTLKEIIDEIKKTLKVEHIPGLKGEIDSYRSQLAGKHYGSDTSIRGGGDTVAAGAGVTITNANGVKTISASGAGFTTLAATETPNGILKTFTFASALAKPSYLVVDNVWQKDVSKSGTINWTWAGTQATFAVPPSDDLWGVV